MPRRREASSSTSISCHQPPPRKSGWVRDSAQNISQPEAFICSTPFISVPSSSPCSHRNGSKCALVFILNPPAAENRGCCRRDAATALFCCLFGTCNSRYRISARPGVGRRGRGPSGFIPQDRLRRAEEYFCAGESARRSKNTFLTAFAHGNSAEFQQKAQSPD